MIDRLDHFVLTTVDREACIDFYTRVLGMQLQTFGQGRTALQFGRQKINLHERGREFEPKAHLPVPGALDLCFIVAQPLDEVIAHLAACGWPIVEGPVERTGAQRRLRSVYVRDPDLNLVELSEEL
jgi:catechol 2,3-dioxygenase-like lactoylglutathione lyase family enzyme